MVERKPDDAKGTAEHLVADGRRVDVTAKIVYGELADELPLIMEGGEWLIDADPLNFYPQDTPTNALRSLLRAVALKRYDVVLCFVPREYREHMTAEDVMAEFEGERREENERILRLLSANLRAVVEQQGDSARMAFGDRYEVKFKREGGVWMIEKLF